jgi:hypothetical protein
MVKNAAVSADVEIEAFRMLDGGLLPLLRQRRHSRDAEWAG